MLGTAQVIAEAFDGVHVRTRALIDPGSECSFVSRALARRLGLPQAITSVSINTIGDRTIETSTRSIMVNLHNLEPSSPFKVHTMVLRHIGITTLQQRIWNPGWPHLENLSLADPGFTIPRNVDLLLGADVYGSLLLEGVRRIDRNAPIAQQTIFGWIVVRPANPLKDLGSPSLNVIASIPGLLSMQELNENLELFWNQEELSSSPFHSHEERECDQHFLTTHRRDSMGR